MVVLAVLSWLVASSVTLALIYRHALLAAWREPVLHAPVLIFESDDWGYGPLIQTERLDRLAALLAEFGDSAGRHPVAALGVVLAGPDAPRIRQDGCRVYHRLALDDSCFAPLREALLRGKMLGVFALQLHGMEHFRPASVLRRAGDARIRTWLTGDPLAATEDLPSALQSRWVDASVLPSMPLSESEVISATEEEASAFASIFAIAPEVAVPTTFVWTDAVERGWIRAGVRIVVTPGLRNESRDAQGRVVPGVSRYYNGELATNGATYVVRDVYFEPALGHTCAQALAALRAKTLAGRPTLLEMHRFNFIGDAAVAQSALDELRKLLQAALAAFPALRFMSTAELAQQYRERSSLVENRAMTRLHFLIRRLAEVSRLRKLAWATGAALPAWLAYVLTRPRDLATAELPA
jgi:hypothetical protein